MTIIDRRRHFIKSISDGLDAARIRPAGACKAVDGGSGTITSQPGGIDCGIDCHEAYQKGKRVVDRREVRHVVNDPIYHPLYAPKREGRALRAAMAATCASEFTLNGCLTLLSSPDSAAVITP